ncbi:MAG: flagellar biosynthesis protein FlgG [Sulfurospirillum sp.]|nr:MAG: flagellar biosynthesis protein FlgG [Sulfurospirillum sp.]
MQSGYYQAAGAMVTQFNRLDVISNNLANVNTSGFRRDNVIIGDFERIYQQKRDELPLQNHTKEAAKFFNRTLNRTPRIVDRYTDFSSMRLRYTGNSLDFALREPDLFFAVETPQGVRLTQQSSFDINSEGDIVTKEGYRLLPEEFVNSTNRNIHVPRGKALFLSDDGTLSMDGKKVAKLFIARVKNTNLLQKEGDTLYKMKDIEKNAIQVNQGSAYVKQGFQQMSNVNAVEEMVALIETNRLVEMYQRVMSTQMDELNRDAVTKLATTRA